jgi:hypothetical protein
MTTTSPLRAWRAHLLLGAWLLVVAIASGLRSRGVSELWADFEEGPVAVRIEAAATLAQRGAEGELAARFPGELLQAQDPRLRELAFLSPFTRRSSTAVGPAELALFRGAERERCEFWWRLRLTTPGRLTMADLERWYELERAGR